MARWCGGKATKLSDDFRLHLADNGMTAYDLMSAESVTSRRGARVRQAGQLSRSGAAVILFYGAVHRRRHWLDARTSNLVGHLAIGQVFPTPGQRKGRLVTAVETRWAARRAAPDRAGRPCQKFRSSNADRKSRR